MQETEGTCTNRHEGETEAIDRLQAICKTMQSCKESARSKC